MAAESPDAGITRLLIDWRNGDPKALEAGPADHPVIAARAEAPGSQMGIVAYARVPAWQARGRRTGTEIDEASPRCRQTITQPGFASF